MRFRGLILSVILLAAAVAPASATMRISEDRGGQIGQYLQTFALLRASGERVIIDGNCLSACTLVLGIIPRDRICATSRARLGFHAAWMPDEDGRPVTSPMGTQALWRVYPTSVRTWITRNGGLSRKMIFLEGRALARYVPSCTNTRTIHARSERRFLPRPVRYEGARAASDRR
jgi:hypothetical protein